MAKAKPAPAPDSLKRERAGTYRSVDGRFTVEQASSGWMVLDAAQADGLGLPLARGPFPTLDGAREAMTAVRAGDGPVSPAAPPPPTLRVVGGAKDPARRPSRPTARPTVASAPQHAALPVMVRELRTADGDALRKLWAQCGLGSLGDDDRSLARMARRNPGLCLVAVEGTRIVGSALAGWDGRRGWIYHVATAPSHRRQGIATRLVEQIEAALVVLGCPKVNAMVQDANEDGRAFWRRLGYDRGSAEQHGKELAS